MKIVLRALIALFMISNLLLVYGESDRKAWGEPEYVSTQVEAATDSYVTSDQKESDDHSFMLIDDHTKGAYFTQRDYYNPADRNPVAEEVESLDDLDEEYNASSMIEVRNKQKFIGRAARAAADKAKALARAAADRAKAAARAAADRAKAAARAAADKAKAAARAAAEKAKAAAKALADKAKAATKAAAEKAKKLARATADKAKALARATADKAKAAAAKAKAAVKKVAAKAKTVAKKVASKAKSVVKNVAKKVTTAAKKVGGAIKGAANTLKSKATALKNKVVSGVKKVGATIKKAGSKLAAGAKKLGGKIAAGAKKIGGKIAAGAKKLGGAIKKVGGKIVAGAKKIGGKIVAGAKKIGGKIVAGAKKLGGAIKKVGGKIVEGAKKIGGKIVAGAKAVVGKAKELAGKAVTAVKEGAKKLASKFGLGGGGADDPTCPCTEESASKGGCTPGETGGGGGGGGGGDGSKGGKGEGGEVPEEPTPQEETPPAEPEVPQEGEVPPEPTPEPTPEPEIPQEPEVPPEVPPEPITPEPEIPQEPEVPQEPEIPQDPEIPPTPDQQPEPPAPDVPVDDPTPPPVPDTDIPVNPDPLEPKGGGGGGGGGGQEQTEQQQKQQEKQADMIDDNSQQQIQQKGEQQATQVDQQIKNDQVKGVKGAINHSFDIKQRTQQDTVIRSDSGATYRIPTTVDGTQQIGDATVIQHGNEQISKTLKSIFGVTISPQQIEKFKFKKFAERMQGNQRNVYPRAFRAKSFEDHRRDVLLREQEIITAYRKHQQHKLLPLIPPKSLGNSVDEFSQKQYDYQMKTYNEQLAKYQTHAKKYLQYYNANAHRVIKDTTPFKGPLKTQQQFYNYFYNSEFQRHLKNAAQGTMDERIQNLVNGKVDDKDCIDYKIIHEKAPQGVYDGQVSRVEERVNGKLVKVLEGEKAEDAVLTRGGRIDKITHILHKALSGKQVALSNKAKLMITSVIGHIDAKTKTEKQKKLNFKKKIADRKAKRAALKAKALKEATAEANRSRGKVNKNEVNKLFKSFTQTAAQTDKEFDAHNIDKASTVGKKSSKVNMGKRWLTAPMYAAKSELFANKPTNPAIPAFFY